MLRCCPARLGRGRSAHRPTACRRPLHPYCGVATPRPCRSRKLRAEIDHNKRLVEDHTEKLSTGRAQIDEIKAETEALLSERNDLETNVLEQREVVSQLEQRLERTRPQSHRVNKDS